MLQSLTKLIGDRFYISLGLLLVLLTSLFAYWYFTLEYKQSIKTVASIPWYTSEKKVRQELENFSPEKIQTKSHLEETSKPGREITAKGIKYNGETTSLTLVFHPDHNLVKAFMKVDFGRGDDCLKVFEKFYRTFNQQYGKIYLNEGRSNELDVSFCHAVLVGKAKRYAVWQDSYGTQLHMLLGTRLSKRHVTIIVETPEYLDWNQGGLLGRIGSLLGINS